MADNSFKIKVETETDFQNVKDLRKELDEMKDQKVTVKADVDTGRIQELEKELDELSTKGTELQDRLNYLKKVNVGFDVHDEEIAEIEKELDNISKRQLEIYTEIDDINLQKAKKEVDNLNGEKVQVDIDTDTNDIKTAKKEIDNLDGEKVQVDIDTDTNDIKTAKKEVDDLNGEKVEIDIDADDSQLKTVRKEVDDLNGEKVQVDVDVDDSQIKAVKKEISDMGDDLSNSLGSTSNAVTGAIAGMAGKSIWDTIYGTSAKAETNKILLKNMSDQSVAYDTLYNTIDSTTDQSLISMQQLIPALNGIKAATGSNAQTINEVTPKVAEFGQYVYALTGSSAKAESAMFDLSKGIKGAYASLDQYCITEDALMRTGLWTGKEDDVIGYMNAVEAVTGSTEELMGTTQGLEALMGKAFSRGGKRIGEDLLPVVKQLITGFMQLDTQTDGWLSTMMLVGGGALTAFTTFLSTAGQVINGFKMMKEAYDFLRTAEILEGIAGWFSISWMLVAIAIGIALGLAIWYLYENVDWFREGVDNLIMGLSNLVNFISSSVIGIFNWLSSLFTDFTSQLGLNTNDWTQAVLGFILFLPQLPIRVGQLLVDTIAKALGFGDDFTNTMITGAMNSVNGFVDYIKSLPGKLQEELDEMLQKAKDFALQIADILSFGGASMVYGWITGSGEHSPGYMYDALLGELTAMVGLPGQILGELINSLFTIGYQMADTLTQTLLGISFDDVITNLFNLQSTFQMVSDYIYTAGGLIPANVEITGNSIIDSVLRVLLFFATIPMQIAGIFADIIGKAMSFGSSLGQQLWSAGQNAVNNFTNSIKGLGSGLAAELDGMINDAINFAGRIGQILWDAGANAISNFLNALDRHSPGIMQREFKAELTEMGDFVPVASNRLGSNIQKMSQNMVDNFGFDFDNGDFANFTIDKIKSILGVYSTNGENSGDTYIFNLYGDMDTEERMKKFLDYVRREIAWNNKTSGRDINV